MRVNSLSVGTLRVYPQDANLTKCFGLFSLCKNLRYLLLKAQRMVAIRVDNTNLAKAA